MSTIPSPVSTGAGGTTFEHKVQTEFVCLMISGGKVCINRFDEGYKIENISFQTRYRHIDTDDMVVTFKPVNGTINKVFAQMKLTIRLSDNDLFKEVINGFWTDFNNQSVFNKDNDVFAIIMGLPTSMDSYNNVNLLVDRARRCIDENEFDLKIVASNNLLTLYNVFKSAIEQANGSGVSKFEIWKFLKCLYVISYDYNYDVSQAQRNIIQYLDTAKRRAQGLESARSVWSSLLSLVLDDNFKAGTINSEFVFSRYPSLIDWFEQSIVEINPIKYEIDEYKVGMIETISSSESIVDENIRLLLLQSMEEVYAKLIQLDLNTIKILLDKYQHPRKTSQNINVQGLGELYELLVYINCKVKNWSFQSFETANLKLIEAGKNGWVQLIYSTKKYTIPMIIMDLGIQLYDQTPNNNYFNNRWIIENANMDSQVENLCEFCGIGQEYPFSKVLSDFGKTKKIIFFENVPNNENNFLDLGNIKICCAKCIRKLKESNDIDTFNTNLLGVLIGD